MINYTPFGHSGWQTIVSEIRRPAGNKTAVVSTINSDTNVPLSGASATRASRPRTYPSWPSRL